MKSRVANITAVLILVATGRCGAQTAEAWMDYFANWSPDNSKWSYEINPGFSKAYGGDHWLDT